MTPILGQQHRPDHAPRFAAAPAVRGDKQPEISTSREDVIAHATAAAEAGRCGRSLAVLDEALRAWPGDRDLLYARALTLLDWGRLNEALEGFRAAEDACLSSFGLYVNLGQVCHACGLTDEAERYARRAIALDQGQAAGHLCLAVVLQAKKRFDEAIDCYESGYAIAPERVDCLWEIVFCRLDHNDAVGGEAVARRAIAIHGNDHPKSWALLGSALALQHRWDEAMEAFERAESIEGQNGVLGETFQMHGFQLFWSGRLNEAIDLYRRYIPGTTNPHAHAHYGLVLLTAGRLHEGWPLYEFRWTFDRLLATRPRFGRPEWRGQELVGKNLLLWAEQGVGDIVQFVRVARLMKEKGAHVLLHVPERLKEFAKSFRDVDRVVSAPEALADGFDYHLSLMSAPGALDTDLDSIPAHGPYLTVDPDRKRRWHERVAGPGLLRVGLAWAGNPNHEHDQFRSIPLARLAPLFSIEGVRFYSLQKEPRADDADALPPTAVLIDLAPELADFRETAAAIDALDLIIAVDTAVVHIAGALGKPAWVMLQTPPDFRWLMEGDGSPWYPTVRLFRQRAFGEWEGVITSVREALAKAARASRADEASVGYLRPATVQDRRVAGVEQAPITPSCGIVDARHGIVQYLRSQDTLARSLEFYGEWLQPQLEVVQARLTSGSVVLEAGSGIGAHTLALARLVGSTGSVFAYEPDRERARILFQNLQLNKVRSQVTLMERRLVGSTTEGPIATGERGAEEEAVDAYDTVDDLALNRLDLLKLNSVRAATEILQGASETIWRLRPLVLAASDSEQLGALAERMESFGYRCWRMVIPYFAETNYSRRTEDIFDGREVLALVGVPEEVEPPASVDAYEEISGPRAESKRNRPKTTAGDGNLAARLMRAIGQAFPFGRKSVSASAEADAPVQLHPATAAQRYNLATSLLMRGEYGRGFDLYESRFDTFEERAAPARKFAQSLGKKRRWRGEPLSRRRIVIWCEQGFGDDLMMLRYLPLLKARGTKKIMVVCERELVDLVKAMPVVDRVFSGNDTIAPDDFDVHCPIMSLPHCCQTTRESVPRDIPYLTVPKDRVDRWRKRLAEIGTPKIGLAWAGGAILEADPRRSIPLAAFEPLLFLPGVCFVSLQKDRRLEDARLAPRLVDWMPECDDFLNTATLIEALDLVISVDTAVAHLAGALGKEVWLLNRFESEWRWGRDATRSVWYPTMTIFNQRNPDRWDEVIGEIAKRLAIRFYGDTD